MFGRKLNIAPIKDATKRQIANANRIADNEILSIDILLLGIAIIISLIILG